MNTELKSLRLYVRTGYNQATPKLDEKSEDVKPYEVARKSNGRNMKEFLFGKVKVYHSTEDHVIEGVNH